MPTYSSRHHEETIGDDQKVFPYKKRAKGIYILDERGGLIPEVEEILDLLKGSGSFLGTGHLSAIEVETLVRRAKELKLEEALKCDIYACNSSVNSGGSCFLT